MQRLEGRDEAPTQGPLPQPLTSSTLVGVHWNSRDSQENCDIAQPVRSPILLAPRDSSRAISGLSSLQQQVVEAAGPIDITSTSLGGCARAPKDIDATIATDGATRILVQHIAVG